VKITLPRSASSITTQDITKETDLEGRGGGITVLVVLGNMGTTGGQIDQNTMEARLDNNRGVWVAPVIITEDKKQ
jgi:hypothetical protein